MNSDTETKPSLRAFRSQVRAIQRAMKRVSAHAGQDIQRLGEVIELDAEWIKWIKTDIEPRFYDAPSK